MEIASPQIPNCHIFPDFLPAFYLPTLYILTPMNTPLHCIISLVRRWASFCVGCEFLNTDHLQDEYKFLDRSLPPSALVTKDQALAASTAFADFLNLLSKQEEWEGQVESEEQMKHIHKEFSELFTKWSKLSQLSVGFMMYLDSRIEADSYLIKVNERHPYLES